jgi:hypothetical protein
MVTGEKSTLDDPKASIARVRTCPTSWKDQTIQWETVKLGLRGGTVGHISFKCFFINKLKKYLFFIF